MAIAFDAASSGSANVQGGTADTITVSHTVGSGSDRILLMTLLVRAPGGAAFGSLTVGGSSTGVTDALTGPVQTGSFDMYVYYLLAPPSGAQNIVWTTTGGDPALFLAGAVSLSGVDQSTPFDGVALVEATQAFGGGPSISNSITPASDNAWTVDFVGHRNDADITPNQTGRVEHTANIGGSFVSTQGIQTAGPISPAASTTMTWSDGADHEWLQAIAALRPAVVAGSTPKGPLSGPFRGPFGRMFG